ncbi:hypothetical protein A2856_03240 [Candidatus Uhrbacteria bacterium RIFCSPHIGHO2_01_FULL_63_20]|uniref:Uncharacterized protein n=1 Tax=Candidatus Uhrbacteria bacterium RIFCSPHIGHO2_01_FULL_63_20 TaxID=1802385 RepID=A0A1F7TMH9_9BACT|nr:MAG: hypothetical protein A2856_03240 [Candidatus Uhrbacteria bacterium RIFCSPHIGHO2_01_FULL_63_20]
MIFGWLFLAVLVTLAGAGVAVLMQEVEQEHDDEAAYGRRIDEQQAAIKVARSKAARPRRTRRSA